MIEKLMLGTVQFGLDYGVANKDGQVPYRKVLRILENAYRRGIRFLDTAISYGDSEKVLGRALDELGLNGAFNIVTKIRPLPADITPDEAAELIRESLEESLSNLRCRHLYGCMFHREEELRFLPLLRKFREQGIIEKYGISIDSAAVATEEIHCDILQLPMNILDRRFENLRTDAEIFARSAFLQGLLLMDETDIPAALAPLKAEAARFEPIRRELGVSRMEFCLRYNLSKHPLNRVLIGVNTEEQLDMNMDAAAKGPLPEAVMTQIEALRRPLPEEWIRPRLWPR
jgi:hypothetical protein